MCTGWSDSMWEGVPGKSTGKRNAFIKGGTLKIRNDLLGIPGRGNKVKRARDLKSWC